MSEPTRYAEGFEEWWQKEGIPYAKTLFGNAWDANVYIEYAKNIAIDAWVHAQIQGLFKAARED